MTTCQAQDVIQTSFECLLNDVTEIPTLQNGRGRVRHQIQGQVDGHLDWFCTEKLREGFEKIKVQL